MKEALLVLIDEIEDSSSGPLLLSSAALLAIAGLLFAPWETGLGLLVTLFILFTLSLGGTFLVALQYVLGARWLASIRRIPESMASCLPLLGASLLILLFFLSGYYPWAQETETGFRGFWLEQKFFLARALIYILLWTLFTIPLLLNSRLQDSLDKVENVIRNIRWSTSFLLLFGLTYWLACHDWILSLRSWHSTLFGIYNFSGLFLAAVAGSIVLLYFAKRRFGPALELRERHIHDLGKLLFTLSNLWMYLWFCQYMLIWYANIPAETRYFVAIQGQDWLPILVLLIACNWVIPFFALLSRWTKMDFTVLFQISLIFLVGRWADVSLMIFPQSVSRPWTCVLFSLMLTALGVVILFRLSLRILVRHPLVPQNDPLIQTEKCGVVGATRQVAVSRNKSGFLR